VKLLRSGPLQGRVANRFVHPEEGLRALEHAEEPVLRSHAVTREAQAALREGRDADFIALRERELHGVLERFVARKTRWDAPDRDRPPIEALVVSDEDD
jgi:hypothetical protein